MKRTIAIMQPYAFPYIGYYQLIKAVDHFVVYDNIKYTKKGWINRNRILRDGRVVCLTIPIKSDPDHLDVSQRSVSIAFNKTKMLNQIVAAYRRAVFFEETVPLLEKVLHVEDFNLFNFIYKIITESCLHVGIKTPIMVSSKLPDVSFNCKGQDRVIEICKQLNGTHYLNPVGGSFLYNAKTFAENNLTLQFFTPTLSPYAQLNTHEFIPALSILDVLFHNGKARTSEMVTQGSQVVLDA